MSVRSFYYILTNDNNYEQTNGIQLELFVQALCWEYYSKSKNLVSYTSNIIIMSLKFEKNLEFFSNFKRKINLDK